MLIEASPAKLRRLRDLQEQARSLPPAPGIAGPSPGDLALRLDGRLTQTPALEAIDGELVRLADGDVDRLMLFMPPQEGKSQRVSRANIVWLLAYDPTLRIAIVSYSHPLARRWSRQVRRDVLAHPELGVMLAGDSRAADEWETVNGGGVIAVGIGGGITGRPVDVLVIDDPVKGRAEAESPAHREAVWSWWENDASTRLSRRGRVVLMMTRWHEDDLAGRLTVREPGRWRVLSIPAIADADDDPLGRAVGDELTSATKDPGHYRALQATRSAYVFGSIYQQRPVPAEGGLFPRGKFRYWQRLPDEGGRARIDLGGRQMFLDQLYRFITVDMAASKRTSADWTVAGAFAMSGDADIVMLGRARGRLGEGEHWSLVNPLRERYHVADVFLESALFSTSLAREATIVGLAVTDLQPDKDKVTRAIPAANRVNAGKVWLPADADWLDEFLDEVCAFPNAAHDDQVDVLAYAAYVAGAHYVPPGFDPDLPRDRDGERITSALGLNGEIDFMNIPL